MARHGTRKYRRQISRKNRRRYCDHETKRKYIVALPKRCRGLSRQVEISDAIADSLERA